MLRILPVLVIAGFAIYSFFDVLATDKSKFRSITKGAWLLVSLVPVVGALLWFIVGRKQREGGDHIVHLRHRPRRPTAPDDDPNFLRKLDEQAWRAKRQAQQRKSKEQEQSGTSPEGQDKPSAPGGEDETPPQTRNQPESTTE